MGYGDQLMATGLARGARARGRRVAFGSGGRIRWDSRSELVFRGNPNIAAPGAEGSADLDWVAYFKGHRLYNAQHPTEPRWVWNLDFTPTPGELYLTAVEKLRAGRFGKGFVLIEPHVPAEKSVGPNKDWGFARYQAVADALRDGGHRVAQFESGGRAMLDGVEPLETASFRDAVAVLGHAALYVGPEGGLHHGAAAMGTPAVVLFGGFIPPAVTGYPGHANLTGGAEACGFYTPCAHCRAAMDAIAVDEVLAAALERLS